MAPALFLFRVSCHYWFWLFITSFLLTLSIYPSIKLFLSIHLSIITLSIYPFIITLSIYPSIYHSFYLVSIYLYLTLSIYPSIYHSFYLVSIYLYLTLSIYPSIYHSMTIFVFFPSSFHNISFTLSYSVLKIVGWIKICHLCTTF